MQAELVRQMLARCLGGTAYNNTSKTVSLDQWNNILKKVKQAGNEEDKTWALTSELSELCFKLALAYNSNPTTGESTE